MSKIFIAVVCFVFLCGFSIKAQFVVPRPVIAAAPVVAPIVPLYNSYLPYYRGFAYPSIVFGSNKNKDKIDNEPTIPEKLNSPFIPKSH